MFEQTTDIEINNLHNIFVAGVKHFVKRNFWIAPLILLTGALLCLSASNALFAQEVNADIQAALRDPVVNNVLESNPQTPEELFRAVNFLIELKHAHLANDFFNKLVAAKIDDATMLKLIEEFKVPAFLRLTMTKELGPNAVEFGKRGLALAAKNAESDQRIDQLVQQLQSTNHFTQTKAIEELRSAGGAAFPPLLAVLANPALKKHHPAINAAIVEQGDVALYPLIAALQSSDESLKINVIYSIAQARLLPALPFLIRSAVSPDSSKAVKAAASRAIATLRGETPDLSQANQILLAYSNSYFERLNPIEANEFGDVEMWSWNADKKQIQPYTVTVDDASLDLAYLLASDAYALHPQDEKTRQLYLKTMLEKSVYQYGLDKPLESKTKELAAKMGVDELLKAISSTVDSKHAPVTLGALQALGEIGKEEILYRNGYRPSVLVEALVAPDRRVRLAAAEALLKINPQKPYPGSSFLPKVLEHFVKNLGSSRAVVADARALQSQEIAGMLVEMGYEVVVVSSRRSMMKEAIRGDTALVVLGMTLSKETIDPAMAELRHDFRTKLIPVAIAYSIDEQWNAVRKARKDPLTVAIVRPTKTEYLEFQLRPLFLSIPRYAAVSDAERVLQSLKALELLSQISKNRTVKYDLKPLTESLEIAAFHPELTEKATEVLGDLGTHAAQKTLANIASLGTQQIATRRAAVKSLDASFQKYGILLPPNEVERQYQIYNASELDGPETIEILGSILDSIEKQAARTSLKNSPAPPILPFEKLSDPKAQPAEDNQAAVNELK